MSYMLFNTFRLVQKKLFSRLLPPLLVTTFLFNSFSASSADEIAGPIHHVIAGDTLYKLAQQYLDDSGRWREFLRDNEIKNPRRLVPGSEIRIPLDPPTVTVIFTHGEVTLVSDGTSSKQALAVGDKLSEGSKVMVGSDSYLSLQFADRSIIRVLSDSVLRLKKVRETDTTNFSASASLNQKKVSRIMELERGNLDVSVTPSKSANTSKKPKPNTFEIITPMAVAAVRGTRFDVSASDTSTTSGVTQGSVDVRQNLPPKPSKKRVAINHVLLDTGSGILVNSDGKLGEVRALLTAPDLSTIPAALNDADYIALNWPAQADAASYHVRIATDADMHQVIQNLESTSPNIHLSNLADGEYVLGVRPVDADGIIGYEATKTLNISANPVFPFYLEPAYKQTVGKPVEIECTPVVDASAYHLQISKDQDFASTVVDVDQLSTCNYTSNELENGQYFWRVASIAKSTDDKLRQGPYSKPSQFEVDETRPISHPDNPANAYWIDESGLTFNAQISSDKSFSAIVQQQTLSQPVIALDKLAAGTYYLRQQAQDAEGFSGKFSAPRKVEIKAIDSSVDRTWADKPK